MSIAAGLSATKTGFELLKGLREALKTEQLDPREINARLLELQEYLLDARQALSDADEENKKLRETLDDRKRKEEFAKQFVHQEGLYWLDKVPYCPVCWEDKHQLTRLSGPYFSYQNRRWTCAIDKSEFIAVK